MSIVNCGVWNYRACNICMREAGMGIRSKIAGLIAATTWIVLSASIIGSIICSR